MVRSKSQFPKIRSTFRTLLFTKIHRVNENVKIIAQLARYLHGKCQSNKEKL